LRRWLALLRGLRNIVVKEVKELLRDPKILLGMLLVPLVMFPLIGMVMQSAASSVKESLQQISASVVDFDHGNYSRNLVAFLKNMGVNVTELNVWSLDSALQAMMEDKISILVVIPDGFSENMTRKLEARVEVYGVFTGKGLVEGVGTSAISSLLEVWKSQYAPLVVASKSIVKGKVVNMGPESLSSLVMSQYFMMPLAVVMLIVLAMQLAATSMASEKEEKTLETLLTLPVDRFTILIGKLSGSVVVAAAGAVGYILGFSYYMASFSAFMPSQIGVELSELGLAPTPLSTLLMGVSMFISLISALALAVIISVFTEDVRGAQAVIGYVSPLLFIPMFVLMLTDLGSLPMPLQIVLLAIPFSHPVLASRAAFTENYALIVGGIIYVSLFTAAILYLAAKLFSTEKILTAKLRLKKFRFKKQ